MKKPNIKKLKYPLWFQIVFYTLTIIAPLIAILVQGYNSNSTPFKFTFTVIVGLILLWIFARKFILDKMVDKLIAKKAALEHDYEIEAGNQEKEKWLWFSNEFILAIVNAIQVALLGCLIMLLAVGIQNAAIKVKGLSLLIAILYFVAYSIKFITILTLRGKDEEVENEQSGT